MAGCEHRISAVPITSRAAAICSCFETIVTVETKWRQAVLGLRNCLRSQALVAQSLQSIMGGPR